MKMKTYIPVFLIAVLTICNLHARSQQWTYAANYGGGVAGFSDAAKAICADASGNIYVTGNFNNSINFGNGTPTLTPTAPGTATEGFVAKFNAAGVCQWAIPFGGAAADQGGLGIITDGTTVYVTGQSQFPATIGTLPLTTVGGSTDGVVFALNAATGATQWARAFGGGSTVDAGQAICMDNTGHIYISGVFSTRTSNPTAFFGTTGAFPRAVQGSMAQATSDLFVAQLDASTGNFNWVSTGGAASQATPLVIGNDNISGSGIAFVPTRNELVITGSFANANASYFSNGSATPAVSLTNAGQSDICLLKLDLSGNFLSGALAAGGSGTEEGLAITYDANTTDLYITGTFTSASVSGAFSVTNSASGFDEIYYARYNPAANTFTWAKSAGGSASGNDVGLCVAAAATGIYVTGRFQGTIFFPTATTPLTAVSSGFDEVFLTKINAATGNATQLATANAPTGTDAGIGVTVSTDHNIWVGGIFAGGTLSFSPSSPAVAVTATVDQQLFIARYNDPPPAITTQPLPSVACLGLPVSFTVVVTGASLTYQWQESVDVAFTAPVTLTNTGIYTNTTTATLNISDNTTLNGKYYRVIVSNSGGTVTSNAALLTATTPVLPAVHVTASHTVNTANNLYYAASCGLIAKIIPSGASPVTGTINTEVWVENTVPSLNALPFVQRHYQMGPVTNPLTATAIITLYFSQAEFDAFNAAPGSTADLPTGPSDNAGKANLRIGKYSGSSNNNSGLPQSYTGAATVIDPADANINWNAATSMWEITFSVTGFSGFFVQTVQYALPVNLLSFAAQLAGTNVVLTWKTADETAHDHFELERSLDGRTFETIASIAPAAGTGIPKSYNYTDANAASLNTEKIYYRLKMVSISGVADYSQMLTVSLDHTAGLITGIGPNPFKDNLALQLYLPASEQLRIKLTGINGQLIYNKTVQAPKGFSTFIIKAATGSTGMYLLTVDCKGKLYTHKVLKRD